ncbi:integrase arm-type DNA-binding domain-containing protein [Sphingomonas sp. PL-96]|uniref:tyrosine-type recombinase/integrase n=1 Tax=Sphingomonas sp. PL-96 TaxID=2887201 RepID=UPI001E5D6237|nr:integrase arm-type DNA-binding domain-containing protein [Sphingomonas sp. PL-96]MCC2977176.1 integrase arm-type DNA-binding domain-containing protein [Sphingomonas sp. PL-96]
MGQLTAMKIKAITEPGRYVDGDGLMLRVTDGGAKSWMVRVRIDGKRRDIGIGSLKVLTLAEARAKATELRRQIAQGIDPIAERKKVEDPVPTFREAATLVHEEHKAAWKNGKHQDQWINTLTTYAFPKLGDRLVNDIEGPIIRDVLAPIWLAKPETARRVRQRIGAVLDWSYAKGYRPTEAPMRSLSKGLPRQPRKDGHFAAMPFTDVPKLIARLRERSSVGRLAMEALILTAARSGEIRGATWNEVDLEAGMWTVPADRMKMGRVHHVPLAPEAIHVFRRAEALRVPCSDLVFPGQRLKNQLSDMTLLKVMRDMETGVTVHGFRSAFRDWVAEETSYPGEVAEAALAHAIPNKVEAAYRRTDFLEKRRSLMREWAAFCTSLMPSSG